MQITNKGALPFIIAAIAAIAVITAIVSYAIGSSWAAQSAYADGRPSEPAACSSCCGGEEAASSEAAGDKASGNEAESCCADAAEVHKEAKRV